jgi:thiamine-phosphate pyrophosphorylase
VGRGGPIPRLHVVTDDEVLRRPEWPRVAAEVLEAGRRRVALHVRGPGLSGRVVYERAESLLDVARATGSAVIVNDRVDVALTLPAVAGVQLRETSLPVDVARRLLGPARWIGASVHGAVRARNAAARGADYVLLGTVFATPTHPARSGGGLALLTEVLRTTALPVLAIGGVTAERAKELRGAGAYGAAVLGGVWRSPDPAGAVARYLRGLES